MVFVLALVGALTPRLAHAQRSAADIESARQLFNEAMALRDGGDARASLDKFRAAHALGNTPITGLELCKTYAALDQPVEAREICLGVGRIPPAPEETARSRRAREEAARVADEMSPRIAIVRLRVTGVPPGKAPTVLVDGAPVPLAALGQARAVNPGVHDIRARIGNGAETRSSIDLAPGERKDITMPVQAPPEDVASDAPSRAFAPPPRKRSNGLAVASFVVGGVGVGVGAIAGFVALGAKSDLDDKCPGGICGRSDHEELARAKRWGTVSTGGFVVGGAAFLLGLYAVLTAPSAAAKSAAAAHGTSANPSTAPRGASVAVDVGPQGVGLHGAF